MGAGDRKRGSAGVADDVVIDLTRFEAPSTGWRTASPEVTLADAGRRSGPWRRSAASRPVPKGQKHAFRPGDATTACGIALDELHAWDDLHFGDGLLNRCSSCLDRLRSLPEADRP